MRGIIQDILKEVICEIETEGKSVQLDNVFFYEFIFKDFTDLIVLTR